MSELSERFKKWCRKPVEGFFQVPWEERRGIDKYTAGLVALIYLTTREVFRDRAPMMAASLSFFTVLAIVPLLTVAASLMAAFGLLEAEGGALFGTLHQLFPDVASGIASYLGEVATQSAQAVGGIGAITLLIIGLVLFNAIEETLTRIWRGAHDRSTVVKMLTFYAMISFGPVLIAMSIVQTAGAQIYLSEIGLDISFFERLLPVVYALVAFSLLYKLVPNSDVNWRAALIGGLYTAVAFELAKWGFNLYVNQMLLQTYDRVYGTLALIPIGLIWVYVTWLVILIGAELAYAFQHLQELMRREAGKRSSEADYDEFLPVHPVIALEILAPILSAFEKGEGPVSEESLSKTARLPEHLVTGVLGVLLDRQVIIEVDKGDEGRRFLPSRPAQSMTFNDLIEYFWVASDSIRVGQLSSAYLEATREFFEGRSVAELIPSDGGSEQGLEPSCPVEQTPPKAEPQSVS